MNKQALFAAQLSLGADPFLLLKPGLSGLRSGASAARRAAVRGMTLVEILVVLAIIGLVMGGVAVVAVGAMDDARQDTATSEVAKISGYAEMYMIKKKKCPKDLKALKSAGIVKKAQRDPWDNDYKIVCEGGGLKGIASAGKDGEWDTNDDVNSWAETAAKSDDDED